MSRSWDQTSKVYTVNLVKKAVTNICDEPQIQRVKRKSKGKQAAGMELVLCTYLCFIVIFLDF